MVVVVAGVEVVRAVAAAEAVAVVGWMAQTQGSVVCVEAQAAASVAAQLSEEPKASVVAAAIPAQGRTEAPAAAEAM